MGDCCWNCKEWEEHLCRDHLQDSNNFIKIMFGDFFNKMELPQKFMKIFEENHIEPIALETSCGKLWDIDLCKEEDHIYFKDGWKQFIHDNKIEEKYILIFEYIGNSTFWVQIFDKTGCRKPLSKFFDETQIHQENVQKTPQIYQTSHSKAQNILRIAHNDHQMLHEEEFDIKHDFNRKYCQEKANQIEKIGDGQMIGFFNKGKKGYMELTSNSRLGTKTHWMSYERAYKILRLKFGGKNENSCFVKLINPKYLRCTSFMAIPIEFSSKHMPEKPNRISVCNQGKKKWFVDCKWRGILWGFSGNSLINLLEENNLQKGDACVFELNKKGKKLSMNMRIVGAEQVLSTLNSYNPYFR